MQYKQVAFYYSLSRNASQINKRKFASIKLQPHHLTTQSHFAKDQLIVHQAFRAFLGK